jgi:ABC-type branched-subunit amino acid transport system substrate-binding protein
MSAALAVGLATMVMTGTAGAAAHGGRRTLRSARVGKAADFVIGTVQATSGTFAPLGQDTLHGLEAEIAILNKRGGILGHHIELVSTDDNSSAQEAVSAVQQMVRSHRLNAFVPDTVLGNIQLPITKSILSVSICSQAVCGDGKTFPDAFSMNPPTSVQVPPMIAYAKKKGLKKTVVVAENTSEGQYFASQVQVAEARAHVAKSPTIYYDPTATSITSELQQARATGAQAVYLWATGSGPSVVMSGMQSLGWKAPVIGVSAIFTGPIQSLVPKALWPQVTCMCYSSGVLLKGKVSPVLAPLAAELKKVGGVHSLLVAALGADIGSAISYAYTKAGRLNMAAAVKALASIGSNKKYPGQEFWTFRHVNPDFHGLVHDPVNAKLAAGFFAVAHPGKPVDGAFPGYAFNY